MMMMIITTIIIININTAYVECKNKGDTGNNKATGTISKSFRKYVSHIPGNHEVMELRKQPYLALHTYFGKC
jgi:uncharacterized lipoprotein YddW (UPF0748 family)